MAPKREAFSRVHTFTLDFPIRISFFFFFEMENLHLGVFGNRPVVTEENTLE